ncbi:MAG: imidazole glycerol phosphate synthase subunit HisH [Oscillospiraceae bacterium]|nr:imidazole glycerol phosphate synthase subunit HisH [Oscillospiraceae bacterium]
MVAIVDYGVGNLFSLRCSLEYIGQECVVTGGAHLLSEADNIILPGVGAFGDAADKLRAKGLDALLRELAGAGKPLLGICLGMQLLFERSLEYGSHQGLGLLPGEIVPLAQDVGDPSCRVPQIGWNTLEPTDIGAACPLLERVQPGDCVYYVHSYYLPKSEVTAAWSGYGKAKVSGIVQRKNVMGTQFHPEKSGKVGLEILRAFCGQ